jgi:amino acid adenylation domain-containing protein
VRAGDRVGLCAPKSEHGVASIFGVLAAGAAYVPVDVTAPVARRATILSDCSPRLAILDEASAKDLAPAWPFTPVAQLPGGLVLVAPESAAVADDGSESAPRVEGLAYILYTSGSTGRPKGVVHTHASALAFVDWCTEELRPSHEDRFSSHAPFHFDLSILDLYVAIKHGAAVILIGEQTSKQPQVLAALIAEHGITVWYSTPSILRLLLDYGHLASHDYGALRIVCFAGEVFHIKHLRALKDVWRQPRYLNLYGPTETNVCTFFEVPEEIPEDRRDPFPIGFACSGDLARVDDGADGDGSEGELLISGPSVMQEYWRLPDRTAEAFVVGADGTRWYRTGDVVRQDPDGAYVYVGRRDRMVKRRGYRVELGEIEAALYTHPAVLEAAAIAVTDDANGVLIHAILATRDGERLTTVQLKGFCAQKLPAYMIPDRFAVRDGLPKTSTDKVDYQRLLASV